MAAPSFIGEVSGSETDADSITLDVSSLSPEDGDLAVAVIAYGAVIASPGPPTGWLRVTGIVIAEDVELEGEVLFRFLSSDDSEFTFDSGDTGPIAAGIAVYRGVESLSALNVEGETIQTVGAGSHVAPDVTTTVNDIKLISANVLWFANTSASVDGGQTERFDVSVMPTGGGTDRAVAVLLGDEDFAAAGATGTRTAATPSESGLSNNVMIALEPRVDERTAFDREQGATQGRLDPFNYVSPEGLFAYVLGRDLSGQESDLNAGDFYEIKQRADFDTAVAVKITANTRGPSDMPPGLRWKFSIRIDGVERASRLLEHNLQENMFDIGANVSQLGAGEHDLAFRLELVSV